MKRIITKNWLRLTLIFLISFSVTLVTARSLRLILHHSNENNNSTDEQVSALEGNEANEVNIESSTSENLEKSESPEFLDLQPIIDEWTSQLPSSTQVGVTIYDLDHDRLAGSYNSDMPFFSASLYKLFLAYTGYAKLSNDESSAETEILPGYSYAACLDVIIRTSDNDCAEEILNLPDQLQQNRALMQKIGVTDRDNGTGANLSANDVTKLLKLYWQHPDLTSNYWTKLSDSMLNQPIIDDIDWRQGLPSGFKVAEVYNKVGWDHTSQNANWDVYHDAAIVSFPELNRHYIVVVMTENLTSADLISAFASSLESIILRTHSSIQN